MSDQEEVDEFLAHYGVLGMKWGVHRSETRAKRKKQSRDGAKRAIKDMGGSKAKAGWLRAGQSLVAQLFVESAGVLVKALSRGNPAVKVGTDAVTTMIGAGNLAFLAKDTWAIKNA